MGKEGFNRFRAGLPKDFNVVAEGGWYALQQRYSECSFVIFARFIFVIKIT